eukprot:scaffold16271_cov132-Isochrysis_galbana.AAC.4
MPPVVPDTTIDDGRHERSLAVAVTASSMQGLFSRDALFLASSAQIAAHDDAERLRSYFQHVELI